MRTSGSREKRKESNRKYYAKLRKDEGKIKERKKKEVEGRKRKRIEISLLHDALVGGEQREKKLKMSNGKLFGELKRSEEIEVKDFVVPQQSVEPQEEEKDEEEKDKVYCWERMEKGT